VSIPRSGLKRMIFSNRTLRLGRHTKLKISQIFPNSIKETGRRLNA